MSLAAEDLRVHEVLGTAIAAAIEDRRQAPPHDPTEVAKRYIWCRAPTRRLPASGFIGHRHGETLSQVDEPWSRRFRVGGTAAMPRE